MKTLFFIVLLTLSTAVICQRDRRSRDNEWEGENGDRWNNKRGRGRDSENEREYQSDDFIAQCLEAHNDERAELGISELTWSEELAKSAQEWARKLAQKNSLKHSNNRDDDVGESIARRKSNSKSVELMLENWVEEKEYYVHRPYPDCSNTGDEDDVSHYTQMIWEDSYEVGCGFASGFGKDYLVCQYRAEGNQDGEYVFGEDKAVDPRSKKSRKEETKTEEEDKPSKTKSSESKTSDSKSSTTESTGDSFIDTCLRLHNAERTPLGIPALKWSEDLAESALDWAKTSAKRNKMSHSDGRVHIGENVAYTGSKPNSLERLIGMWTDEKENYVHKPYPDCTRTGDTGDVGHYTQIIWKDTTEVGCGVATGSGRDYIVCQYKTSGNRRGKYAY
jgi:uncharacterized protein YkwD